jgi:polysaccharide pyruvyl transferase CsaB
MSRSKKVNSFSIIIFLLLLPGILVAFWRSAFRIAGEQKNQLVEIAVDFEEFKQLALEENLHIRDLLGMLKNNGASTVVLSEDSLESLEKESKITIMTTQDIKKLSLDENFKKIANPVAQNALATLWVQSEDNSLLDRIEHILSLKIQSERLIRIDPHLLLINKSTQGFKEQAGLGFSQEAIEMANDAELGVILRLQNYPNLTKENAIKYLSQLPSPGSVSGIMFAAEESFGYRGEHKAIVELLRDRAYRLCSFEFTQPKGMGSYLKALRPKNLVVQGHSISRKEMDQKYKLNTAIARWVRAVKERSIRLLYLRCFYQPDDHFIDNLAEHNLSYVAKVSKKLKALGFKMAQNHAERINEPRLIVGPLVKAELFVTGLALILGFIILLKITLCKNISNGLLIGSVFLSGLGFLLVKEPSWVAFSGLIGAISYAALGPVWFMNSLHKREQAMLPAANQPQESQHNKALAKLTIEAEAVDKPATDFFEGLDEAESQEKSKNRSEPTPRPPTTLKLTFNLIFKTLITSVLGGILLVGLHSNLDFMLKYSQFRGIKLAFVLPLLISALWALKLYGTESLKLLHRPINLFSLILLGLGLFGLVAYVMRSGNLTIIKPSLLEERFRILLEDILLARPRYKEFLIGYPACFLFAFFYMRKTPLMLPAIMLFVQMASVSVLNSFCHFHTPLLLTILRVFNGLWIGIFVGFLALMGTILVRLLYKLSSEKERRLFLVGYFGFGNGGDELLWQTFAERFSQEHPDYEVSVLYSSAKTNKASRFKLIQRKTLTELLDEIITCKFLVVPGGGVFQSKTSLKSLSYYLSLITLARICGARVLLISQGLGPWQGESFMDRLLMRWLGRELRKAHYVSLRDKASGEDYTNLTGSSEYFLTTDLVFLNKAIKKASQRNIHKVIRVYAVLRSSVKESLGLAQALLKLTATDETIELIPISMQPDEDEQVWHDAGWSEEVSYIFNSSAPFEGADMVVSMRLHGCILSTVTCTPWLGLAYDPKVKAYADSIKWELCKKPNEVSEEYLALLINELKKSRSRLSERLHNNAIECTKLAEVDYQRLLKSIFK